MSIITPNRTIVVPFEFGMAGLYRLQVGRRGCRPRIDTGWFPNLITDWGLNAKGGVPGNFSSYAHVGSGNTAPTNGDTTLVTWIASTSNTSDSSQGAQASAPYYGWYRITKQFAEGAAAGNISEVGIGNLGGSTDPLFSRALILDAQGSPTTITVLADEILQVTYEARSYPPTVDGSFVVADGGTNYTVTTRASSVTSTVFWGGVGIVSQATWADPFGNANNKASYDGVIGAITQEPSGTASSRSSWSALPYINNSLEREVSVVWGIDRANFGGGVKSIYVASSGNIGTWQAEFDPPIPKIDTQQLTINMKVGWGRASI